MLIPNLFNIAYQAGLY